MELYIHYKELHVRLRLEALGGEPDVILGGTSVACGGEDNRLDLDLEDEKVNPKYAQMAVKAYLQRAGFSKETAVEIGGMEIGIYE